MKRIIIILLICISFFGLGMAVYASPINQKVSEGLDAFIASKLGKGDPCEVNHAEPKENCLH